MMPLGVLHPHLEEEEEEEPGMKLVGVLCSNSEKLGTRFPGLLC
jgi:hypothetical protein